MPSNGLDKTDRRLAKKARRQEDKRDAILQAAQEVLNENGLEGLTIPKVAARAKLTKPAVYYYFDSKEALLERLMIHHFQIEGDLLMVAVKAQADGVSALKALVSTKVDHYVNHPEVYRVVYVWPQQMALSPQTMRAEIYPIGDRVNGTLEEVLTRDQRRGRLSPRLHPRRLANLAWYTAQGILSVVIQIQAMGGDTRYGAQQLVDEFHTLLDHTVLNPDESRGLAPPT